LRHLITLQPPPTRKREQTPMAATASPKAADGDLANASPALMTNRGTADVPLPAEFAVRSASEVLGTLASTNKAADTPLLEAVRTAPLPSVEGGAGDGSNGEEVPALRRRHGGQTSPGHSRLRARRLWRSRRRQ